MSYITRERALEYDAEAIHTRNLPSEVTEAQDLAELRSNLTTYAEIRDQSEQALHRSTGECRTHYRATLSFEREVSTEQAKALADEWLKERFPEGRAVVAVHRDTDHVHAHVWIDARQENGKKIDLSPRQYRTLDESWNKIYSREMGRDEREHLTKKQESQEYKRDRVQGIERESPRRVDMRGIELRTVCQARDERSAPVLRVEHVTRAATRDPQLVRLARDLRTLEDRAGLEQARLRAIARSSEGQRAIRAQKQLQRPVEGKEQQFKETLATIYRDPVQAQKLFEEKAAREGWSAALREMRQQPESYGKLRGYQFAGYGTDARVDAVEAVPHAAQRGGDYLAARAQAEKAERAIQRTDREVERAKGQHERINQRLERMPSKADLEARIGRTMDALTPTQRQSLVRAIEHDAAGRAGVAERTLHPAAEPSLQALAGDLRSYEQAQAVDGRYREILRDLGAARVEAVRAERQGRPSAEYWTEVRKIEARVEIVRAELKQHGVKELEQRIGDTMNRLRERGVTAAKLERIPEDVRAGITFGQLKAAARMMEQALGREREEGLER
jgi:hypothetical protein